MSNVYIQSIISALKYKMCWNNSMDFLKANKCQPPYLNCVVLNQIFSNYYQIYSEM